MVNPAQPSPLKFSDYLGIASGILVAAGVTAGTVMAVRKIFSMCRTTLTPQAPSNAQVLEAKPYETTDLVEKQKDHLGKLQAFAAKGEWEHLQGRTSNPDSDFSLWMLPATSKSPYRHPKYGWSFSVKTADIYSLKRNIEFMKSYRDGIRLVAKSWGWDLETGKPVANSTKKQQWKGDNNSKTRFREIQESLATFGETDLKASLEKFLLDQATS